VTRRTHNEPDISASEALGAPPYCVCTTPVLACPLKIVNESSARRSLHIKHQLDLTLVRPDGTLHAVELKRARIESLIVAYREGWVLGDVLAKSIGQARNYLVALDENRHQILNDVGIDTRRASITIVAGHSDFVGGGACANEVADMLRRNNSHDPRVKIITYDELMSNARRAMSVTDKVLRS
jgi:hypothetical protein